MFIVSDFFVYRLQKYNFSCNYTNFLKEILVFLPLFVIFTTKL